MRVCVHSSFKRVYMGIKQLITTITAYIYRGGRWDWEYIIIYQAYIIYVVFLSGTHSK